jgi:hypothetical protein
MTCNAIDIIALIHTTLCTCTIYSRIYEVLLVATFSDATSESRREKLRSLTCNARRGSGKGILVKSFMASTVVSSRWWWESLLPSTLESQDEETFLLGDKPISKSWSERSALLARDTLSRSRTRRIKVRFLEICGENRCNKVTINTLLCRTMIGISRPLNGRKPWLYVCVLKEVKAFVSKITHEMPAK